MAAQNMFSDVNWREGRSWHLAFRDEERELTERVALIASFALLTSVCAQLQFTIPMLSPVPFTMQVFGVMSTGVYLRKQDALASGLLYLALGAIGLPVYAGSSAGLATLFGATGGYLLAFPIASALVATGFDYARSKGEVIPLVQWGMWLVSLSVIYVMGMIGLKLTLGVDWTTAWAWGVAPFILWDCAKMGLLAAVTTHLFRYQ